MCSAKSMADAIAAFRKDTFGCTLDPKPDKPIYTLVKVLDWPSTVHYEFRSQDELLFVELHIENRKFAFLGPTFEAFARGVSEINGYRLEYHERRVGRNRKVWPSLSVQLPEGVSGEVAASIMHRLISATKPRVSQALSANGNGKG